MLLVIVLQGDELCRLLTPDTFYLTPVEMYVSTADDNMANILQLSPLKGLS